MTAAGREVTQIRLTNDPKFRTIVERARSALELQAGRPVGLIGMVRPALEHLAALTPAEIQALVHELDLSKEADGGSVRVAWADLQLLDLLITTGTPPRERKHHSAKGRWSRRVLLVLALFAYSRFTLLSNDLDASI